jgi:hypothetical protein
MNNQWSGACLLALSLLLACESYRPPRDQLPQNGYRVINSVREDYEVELSQPAIIEKQSLPAGTHLVFAGQNLKAIVTAQSTNILGADWPSGTRLEFAFGGYYAGTSLQRAVLGAPIAWGPKGLDKGDAVKIDGTLRVRSAVLGAARSIGGRSFSEGDVLNFDDLGAVRTHMSKEEAQVASDVSSAKQAEQRAALRQRCNVKCASNDSCFQHCLKYGY